MQEVEGGADSMQFQINYYSVSILLETDVPVKDQRYMEEALVMTGKG